MVSLKKIGSLAIAFVIIYSCKKNTPGSTSTPAPTNVSTLIMDGKSVSNLSHSSFSNGGNLGVIAYGTNSIPELQITFSGTVTPAIGTYAITSNTVSYGLCNFTLADTVSGAQAPASIASNGYLTVTASGASPNNSLTFSNISVTGSSGHHTLSGTIYY